MMVAVDGVQLSEVPSSHGYFVSRAGDVYSVRRLSAAAGAHGYRAVATRVNGKTYTRTVHSLIAEAFLGPRVPGLIVRHLNGDRMDNSVDNLAYGTYQDNADDIVRYAGRHRHGSEVGNAALKEVAAVAEIRRRLKEGDRGSELASDYGVSAGTISNVRRGRHWTNRRRTP